MIINPYIYSGGSLFDDTLVVYSLRVPAMTNLWTNAVVKVRRDSDDATAYVFPSGAFVNATISTSSFISTTSNTTPSAVTLGTWISTDDGYVEEWIGQTPDNVVDTNKILSQATLGQQPQLVKGGAVHLENGRAVINFDGTDDLYTSTAHSSLNNTETFTIMAVSLSTGGNSIPAVWSTQITTTGSRLTLYNSRSGTLMVKCRHTANNHVNYLSADSTTVQRLQTVVYDDVTAEGWKDSVAQTGVTVTQDYANNGFKVGREQTTVSPLTGGIQEVIIFPSDKTSDLTALNTNINTYYTIY